MLPLYLEPNDPIVFPDPETADAEGLVAVGGDLCPERLMAAYGSGVFPWYDRGVPPLWWSPDPRGVLQVEDLHISRRLARRLRRGEFRLTWNRAFSEVMVECSRDRSDGTWILPDMVQAYSRLHAIGKAHSLEVWERDELVGGIYGVQCGGLFAAESMFHRVSDASKVALVVLVRSLFPAGIELFDVQFVTPHLASMGATSWPRRRYLDEVRGVRDKPVDLSALQLIG